jgi:hypothetical protein
VSYLRSGRVRRTLIQPAVDNHLHFNAPVLLTSGSRRIVSHRFRLTVAHRRDKPAERNLVLHCQVLHHRVRTRLAQPEILGVTARRIRMTGNRLASGERIALFVRKVTAAVSCTS